MQSLYEWDFKERMKEKAHRDEKNLADFDEILARNIKESKIDPETDKFIFNLRMGIFKNLAKIDQLISENAPEWPLEQIARIDRSILRIGTFELCFSKEIPTKVAIDEAVELAKAFGGENSSKFVNGVLGSIYRKTDQKKEKDEKEKK